MTVSDADVGEAEDTAFGMALARGLAHFARFAGASRIDVAAIEPAELRERVQDMVMDAL